MYTPDGVYRLAMTIIINPNSENSKLTTRYNSEQSERLNMNSMIISFRNNGT